MPGRPGSLGLATLPDITPDPFAFAAIVDAARNAVVTSAPVEVTGTDAPAPVTISGEPSARFRINGGGWVTSATMPAGGATLELQMTASGDWSTEFACLLNIAGVTAGWLVTTAAEPFSLMAALTAATAADIQAGGETLLVTVAAETWAATLGEDNAVTTAWLDSFAGNGDWATIRASLDFSHVTRLSDSQARIDLPPVPAYEIAAPEIVTADFPATVFAGATDPAVITVGTISAVAATIATEARHVWRQNLVGEVTTAYLWHSVAFPKGAVPAGYRLQAAADATPFAASFLAPSTWDDGSLRFAMAAYKLPWPLAFGEVLDVTFAAVPGEEPVWAGDDPATIAGALPSLELTFSGGASGTSSFAGAVANWSRIWGQGSEAIAIQARQPIAGSKLHCLWWLLYFADGKAIPVVQVLNGTDEQDQSVVQLTVNATFKEDGATQAGYSYTGLELAHHAGPIVNLAADSTYYQVGGGGDPVKLTPEPSHRMWALAGLAAPYEVDQATSPNMAAIPALPGDVYAGADAGVYHPTDVWHCEQDVGLGGYRPDIGMLPGWCVYHLMRPTAAWWQYVRRRSLNWLHMPRYYVSTRGGGSKFGLINTTPWAGLHADMPDRYPDWDRLDCITGVSDNGTGQHGWSMYGAYGKAHLDYTHDAAAIEYLAMVEASPWFVYAVEMVVGRQQCDGGIEGDGADQYFGEIYRSFTTGPASAPVTYHGKPKFREVRQWAWMTRSAGYARFMTPDDEINAAYVARHHAEIWEVTNSVITIDAEDAYEGRSIPAAAKTRQWLFWPNNPHSIMPLWQVAHFAKVTALDHRRGWAETTATFDYVCRGFIAALMGNHQYAAIGYRTRPTPSGAKNTGWPATGYFTSFSDAGCVHWNADDWNAAVAWPVDHPDAGAGGYQPSTHTGGESFVQPYFNPERDFSYFYMLMSAVFLTIWAGGGNADTAAALAYWLANDPQTRLGSGGDTKTFENSATSGLTFRHGWLTPGGETLATLSGTLAAGAGEGDIRAGGRALQVDLANGTWHADIAANVPEASALLDAISGPGDWSTVRAALDYTAITRDSDTRITLTLPPVPAYSIAAADPWTLDIPVAALATWMSDPTPVSIVTVAPLATSATASGPVWDGISQAEAQAGGQTLTADLVNATWHAGIGAVSVETTALLDALTGNRDFATIRGLMDASHVERVSDTRVTITLPPAPAYDPGGSDETIMLDLSPAMFATYESDPSPLAVGTVIAAVDPGLKFRDEFDGPTGEILEAGGHLPDVGTGWIAWNRHADDGRNMQTNGAGQASKSNSGIVTAYAMVPDTPLAADQYVEGDSGGATDDPQTGLMLRAVDLDNKYHLHTRVNGILRIYRTVGGVQPPEIAGTGFDAWAPGDTLRFEAETIGAAVQLRVYVNGDLVLSHDDTDADRITAAGSAGMVARGALNTGDHYWSRVLAGDLA
ncbi:hypothetical protein OCH7691_04495 [Oceanibacterium hippocampi]|uniref:Uncharacterized protein n=2 Tax=Oceanibacterium hippocampi TaxID=745714 RepID=A0A1Y5TZR6_9PROT|nr:hypothetical protein OCH7691_04495 [Oceanibacterium hippocampi]